MKELSVIWDRKGTVRNSCSGFRIYRHIEFSNERKEDASVKSVESFCKRAIEIGIDML